MFKKKIVFIITSVSIVSSLIFFSVPKETHAEVYTSNSTDNGTALLEKQNNITPLVLSDLRHLSAVLTNKYWAAGEIKYNEMVNNIDPWSITEIGAFNLNNDMKILEGDTLAAHSAPLNNLTGVDQTLTTAAFEYTQENSVITRTSHITGANLTTSGELKFPVGSGSMSLSVKYEFNHTNEVKTSEIRKWIVPAQQIKVPAGHRYHVNWILKQGTATGTVNLQSQVKGFVPFKSSIDQTIRYGWSVGTAINQDNRLSKKLDDMNIIYPVFNSKNQWTVNSDSSANRNLGTATYQAKYGTELIMQVVDVTNAKMPVEVSSIPLNLTSETLE